MSKKLRRNSNSVLKRIMTRLLKFAIFVGVPVLLFLYTFRLEKVTITGAERNSSDQIKEQIIKDRWDNNALLLYLKYTYFTDVDIPFVEKLDFKLVNNNTVDIRVYEKMVTGCVEFMGEYLYFDKDGIVVESSSKQLEDIPQIKGLHFNRILLNETLRVQKDELFDVILNLTQLIDKFGLEVTTIQFNNNYEVRVDCGNISADLGRRSTYDEVLAELRNIIQGTNKELAEILDKLEGQELVLDMTKYNKDTDQIVAKPKNRLNR